MSLTKGFFAPIYRSPTRHDEVISHSNVNNRLRRTLASRSMSAEVFHSSSDTGSAWKTEYNDDEGVTI